MRAKTLIALAISLNQHLRGKAWRALASMVKRVQPSVSSFLALHASGPATDEPAPESMQVGSSRLSACEHQHDHCPKDFPLI